MQDVKIADFSCLFVYDQNEGTEVLSDCCLYSLPTRGRKREGNGFAHCFKILSSNSFKVPHLLKGANS